MRPDKTNTSPPQRAASARISAKCATSFSCRARNNTVGRESDGRRCSSAHTGVTPTPPAIKSGRLSPKISGVVTPYGPSTATLSPTRKCRVAELASPRSLIVTRRPAVVGTAEREYGFVFHHCPRTNDRIITNWPASPRNRRTLRPPNKTLTVSSVSLLTARTCNGRATDPKTFHHLPNNAVAKIATELPTHTRRT